MEYATMTTLALSLFFGLLIGLALGLLGGGGSILTVPVLIYVLGQSTQAAVATSLAIVGTNAVVGTAMHWRAGHVRAPQALAFGAAGVLAAYWAAGLSKLVSDSLLLVLFALLMLLVGGLMIHPLPIGAGTNKGQALKLLRQILKTIAAGSLVGVLTGFLGVGGGFLVVPALVLVLGLPMADAVGSSLLVIALNAGAGLLGHLHGGSFDWTLVGVFVLAGVAGLALGTRWSLRWPQQRLRRAFATLVLSLAVALLAINLPPLLTSTALAGR
jgi:uncharacterized protein